MYIAMKLHNGEVDFGGMNTSMGLPNGCEGILFVFKNKKSAKEFWGKETPLAKVKMI